MKAQRVLVTDGEQRSALAVVRALGRVGHRVLVSAGRGRSLAGASRYCDASAQVADALTQPESFAEDVERFVRRSGVDVLIPVTDAATLALLPIRDRLAPAVVACGDADSFRRLSDKQLLLDTAPRFGIAVPRQRVLATPGDGAGLAPGDLDFPLIVKPARSVAERDGRRIKLGVQHAASSEQLATVLSTLEPAAYPILLQERVVGPGVGIFLLLWDGRVIAEFSHRRIREKPPSGGVSVYRESIPADPALVERSRALLEHFGWRGVAMIEYKVHEVTNTPYLLEVNARFWGSLQLAVDAGVNFPALLVSLAAGGDPAPVRSYRTGVRSRWWWGDVDQLLTRLRHSPEALGLPPDAPGRWRAVRDFLALWRPGDRSEVLRAEDPRPFVRETIDWLARR